MFNSTFSLIAAVIGLSVGAACFAKSLAKLENGLHFLILIVLFGGIVSVNFGSGVYAIAFRDVFIVLPLYLCVLSKTSGQEAISLIPGEILLALLLLISVVAVCIFNPANTSMGQVLIGLKVWLFYIPLLVIGVVIGSQPALTMRVLHLLFVWGTVACAIGLLQSLLVRIVGYSTVMHWFFGANAARVTQDFAFFEQAGGIYRIPGTFSFTAQYSGFLYIYLPITVIVSNIHPDPRFRQFARIAVFMAVIAGVLSGSRSNILIFPALLAIYAFCGVLSSRLLLLAPVGLAAGMGALALSHVDLVQFFIYGRELAGANTTDFIVEQVTDALGFGLLGDGIGAATGAARYAAGAGALDTGAALGFESYFAKAAAELGWLGLCAIVILFIVILMRAISIAVVNLRRGENAITAPLLAYIGLIVVTSLRGWPLDTDPGNIFFWLFLGLMVGIDRTKDTAWSVDEDEGTAASALRA